MPRRVLFESCVESLDAALASAEGGADRIELCACLDVGGTTPDIALVERVIASGTIPVFAMARPRGGPFVYDTDEVSAIARDIRALQAAGANGIVMGALTPSREIDIEAMRRLIDIARPLPVTFHRAFDEARDLIEALDALLGLGVDRVLTSGGAPTATAGAATLRRLVERAEGRLVVIAGGGVRFHNVASLVGATGVTEVHARLIRPTRPSSPHDVTAWRDAVSGFVEAMRAGPDLPVQSRRESEP